MKHLKKFNFFINEDLNKTIKVDEKIIKFVNDRLNDITPRKIEDYPDSTFYMLGSKYLLQMDFKNNILWCRYEGFWEILSNIFNMEYDDIQFLIKNMVELKINHKIANVVPFKSNIDFKFN